MHASILAFIRSCGRPEVDAECPVATVCWGVHCSRQFDSCRPVVVPDLFTFTSFTLAPYRRLSQPCPALTGFNRRCPMLGFRRLQPFAWKARDPSPPRFLYIGLVRRVSAILKPRGIKSKSSLFHPGLNMLSFSYFCYFIGFIFFINIIIRYASWLSSLSVDP